MHAVFERLNRRLATTLDLGPRIMLAVAGFLLAAVFIFPLWDMTMFAPQYQDGLRLHIYSHKLEGGNNNQDIREINTLNHYIGMHELADENFTEFKWLPFVIGALALLYLRAAAVGTVGHLVDVLVLNIYFSAFALWSFGHRMYLYGHTLSPNAAMKIAPFTPPIFGSKQLANFTVFSYPGVASYAMGLSTLLLIVAMVIGWRSSRPAARRAGA